MGVRARLGSVVVICILLISAFAGCIDDNPDLDDEPDIEMDFFEPEIYRVEKDEKTTWTVELIISSIESSGIENLSFNDFSVVVVDPDGQVVHEAETIGSLPDVMPVSFGAYYTWRHLTTFEPGGMVHQEVRTFVVTGLTDDLAGGTVRIMLGELTATEVSLPSKFETDVSVEFGNGIVTIEELETIPKWRYEASVSDIVPELKSLFWWTLMVGVRTPDDVAILPPRPISWAFNGRILDDDYEMGVWYTNVDNQGIPPADPTDPLLVHVGDLLTLTNITREYEGAIIDLFKGADLIWSSQPIPEFPIPFVEIELGSPIVEAWHENETAFLEASFEVKWIDPPVVGTPWEAISVNVLDDQSRELFSGEVPNRDPGSYCQTPSVWFEDDGTADGSVSLGDTLRIKGMDLSFKGAHVELYLDGDLSFATRLPTIFPISGFSIYPKSLTMTERTVGNETRYDAAITIGYITPDNMVMPWDYIQVRLMDRTRDIEVRPYTTPVPVDHDTVIIPAIMYDDSPSEDGVVTVDDLVWLIGLTEAFEGVWFEFYLEGEMIGDEVLPEVFNLTRIITIQLASPSVTRHDINESTDWHAIFNINKITPETADTPWTEIEIRILDPSGAVLVPLSSVIPDPGVYDENETDGFDIGLWYIEIMQDGVTIGAGDSFKITGMTEAYQGGRVQIYHKGTVIGDTVLPTEFP